MLNNNELKKNYPKAHKHLLEWSKKYLRAFTASITSDSGNIDIPEDVADKAIEGIILLQSRTLYDFFDEKEIYISMIYDSKDEWEYTIDVNGDASIGIGPSRTLAEEAAFLEAFSILEKQ